MRNPKGSGSIIPFILFMLLFFGGGGSILGGLIGLGISFIVGLLPIIAIGIFIVALFSGSKSGNKKQNKKKGTTVRKSNGQTSVSSSGKITNSELAKVDKKLKEFFKDNVSLPIIDDVSLCPQKGNYTTIDELFITYKDEKLAKLSDFRDTSEEAYDKVVSLLVAFSKQKEEVLKEKVTTTAETKSKKLSDAEKYIDKINEMNDRIPNEEISNGLYQTCTLLKQLDVASKKTGKEKGFKKLFDYYLPILVDILEKYDSLEDEPIHGDEFKKTEAQLIKTIVLINEALKTIYTSIHEDDYMNLNADISTLQSLLQKDGLVENSFKGGEEKHD